MTYQPVLPATGLVGWQFLQRTYDAQSEAFRAGARIQADGDYFRDRIAGVTTAAQLVEDRRLLGVALSAFGLGDDIDNRHFVRRILEDGVGRSDALANRLADDRYKQLATAFGFGDLPVPRTQLSYFADEILDRYARKEFELAVGAQDNDMRLALNARDALAEIAAEEAGADTRWFRIMGNAPLRKVMETALGLPPGFGQIDLDQQLEAFRDRARSTLGSGEVAQFTDPEAVERVTRLFMLRSQLDETPTVAGTTALTLLQSWTPQRI